METALFGAASIWLIRQQRFVALPLMIALGYNHRDVLEKNQTVQDVTHAIMEGLPGEWLSAVGVTNGAKATPASDANKKN